MALPRVIAGGVGAEQIRSILFEIIDLEQPVSVVAKKYSTTSKTIKRLVSLFMKSTPDEFDEFVKIQATKKELLEKHSPRELKNFLRNEIMAYIKERAILEKGGCCQACGYDGDQCALDFHHINPAEKEHKIAKIRTWEVMSKELEKCILVCANCHRSIHSGKLLVPENYARNENYFD